MDEVVPFEQERLAGCPRERVREAISKIQSSRMSGAAAVVAIGLSCGLYVILSQGHNLDFGDQLVESGAEDRIAIGVDDGCRLDEGRGRHP